MTEGRPAREPRSQQPPAGGIFPLGLTGQTITGGFPVNRLTREIHPPTAIYRGPGGIGIITGRQTLLLTPGITPPNHIMPAHISNRMIRRLAIARTVDHIPVPQPPGAHRLPFPLGHLPLPDIERIQ